MKTRNAGLISGIIILGFSILCLVLSFGYKYHGPLQLGPGFFARWISGGMVVLSLLYIIEAYKKRNENAYDFPKGPALLRMSSIILSMVLFLCVVQVLGFTVTCTIFLFVLWVKAYKWYISLPLAIVVSVSLFAVFRMALGVPLPVNIFGF